MDLWLVIGLDYLVGEVFNIISCFFNGKGIEFVISGVGFECFLGCFFCVVGLGEDGIEVKFFLELNLVLEYCENEFFKIFYVN